MSTDSPKEDDVFTLRKFDYAAQTFYQTHGKYPDMLVLSRPVDQMAFFLTLQNVWERVIAELDFGPLTLDNVTKILKSRQFGLRGVEVVAEHPGAILDPREPFFLERFTDYAMWDMEKEPVKDVE